MVNTTFLDCMGTWTTCIGLECYFLGRRRISKSICTMVRSLKLLPLFFENMGSFLTSWWFQPIWKICSSNWIISPIFGVNIKKCLSCHHLVERISEALLILHSRNVTRHPKPLTRLPPLALWGGYQSCPLLQKHAPKPRKVTLPETNSKFCPCK